MAALAETLAHSDGNHGCSGLFDMTSNVISDELQCLLGAANFAVDETSMACKGVAPGEAEPLAGDQPACLEAQSDSNDDFFFDPADLAALYSTNDEPSTVSDPAVEALTTPPTPSTSYPPAKPSRAARKRPQKKTARGDAPYPAAEWRERAFPGLQDRRWVQLLVDDRVAIWADPVTHRQFIPTADSDNRLLTGDFLEIDPDHCYYVDAESLKEAILHHNKTSSSSSSTAHESQSTDSLHADSELEVRSPFQTDASLGVRTGGVHKKRQQQP